jgi:excisionase family DNA binding protein
MLPPLLTPEQVGEILGLRVKKVHELVREGSLACIQITARDRKFSEEQIKAFIDSRTVTPPKIVDRKSPSKLPFPRKGGTQGKSTGVALSKRQMKEEMALWR